MPTGPAGRAKTPIPRRAARLRVAVGRLVIDAPWRALVIWLVAWTTIEILLSRTHMYSWHYVLTGARVMRSPGWFLLYGRHPELQMGPLTFLAAQPFSLLAKEPGRIVAAAAMAALGLLVVREVRALVRPASASEVRRWALVSAVLLVGWLEVGVRFGHLDDVLALLFGVIALRCARSGRPVRAGLLIGLSIDSKPWALPLAAVLLLLPDARQRLLAAGITTALVVVVWAPFLLLDAHALAATRFVIHVDPASTLHLLGVGARSTPPWCRPAQIVLGAVLAIAAVQRGRWPGVLVVVVCARLLLDPAVQPYYDSGLLIGSAVLDLATARPRRRWVQPATLTVLLLVYLPSYVLTQLPEERGVLRTAGLLVLIALANVRRPTGSAALAVRVAGGRPLRRSGLRPTADRVRIDPASLRGAAVPYTRPRWRVRAAEGACLENM